MEPLTVLLSDDGESLTFQKDATSSAKSLASYETRKFDEKQIKNVSEFLAHKEELDAEIKDLKAIEDGLLDEIVSKPDENNEFVSFKVLRSAALQALSKPEDMTKESFLKLLNSVTFANAGKFKKLSGELFMFFVLNFLPSVNGVFYEDIKEMLVEQIKYTDINAIEANENSQKLANIAMNLAIDGRFSDEDSCSAVGGIIASAFKADVPTEFMENMKDLIVEKDGVTIKNHLFIIPLLHAFMFSERFSECFVFINKLMDSRANALALHEAKVDVQIINTIKRIQGNVATLSPVIGAILSILSRIAVIASSLEVVTSMLSLFNPINGCLSKLHSTYLASLVDIVSFCINEPECFFNNLSVQVEGLTTTSFAQSFFVGMWLYIPTKISEEEKNQLFSILDSNGIGFTSFIKGTTLYGIQKLKGKEADITFGAKLPQDAWFHLGLQFTKQDKKLNLIQTVNDQTLPVIQLTWPEFHRNSPVKIEFGENKDSQICKGSMAIFSSLEEMQQMHKEGPRSSVKQAIACVKPLVCNDKLTIIGLPRISYDKSKEVAVPMTFIDYLIRSVKIQAFLPIFDTLDLKFPDGEQVPVFASALIDLILFATRASERAVNDFLDYNGFALIAECLSKNERRNFDYAIYQKFYTVFNKETNQRLKMAVLKDILLNLNLWVHASSQDQIQITRHWGRVLYQNHAEMALQVYNFTDLLSLLRIYYWYAPLEIDIICNGPDSKTPRPDDLDIQAIRSGIIQALHTISRTSFDKESLQALIGTCVTCKDFKQVVDILLLIKMIAVSEEQPFLKVQEDRDLFGSLHHLINCENEDISFSAIEDIAALHFLDYIQEPKVKYHVATLMEMAPLATYSLNFFAKLIPFTAKYPDFLPFAFYYVIHSGEKAGADLMKFLKPSSDYSQKKMWALWPIISALYIGGDYCKDVMNFIARCSNENWKITFTTIEVIALALGVDDQQPKSWFIHSLTLSLLDQPLLSFEYLHQFFDLAIFHMFSRPNDIPADHIKAILDEINFGYDGPLAKPTSAKERRFDKQKLISAIQENMSKKRSYHFGLRLGPKGEWLDAQCGLDLIMQAKRTKVQTYHNFSALLAAFAINDKPEEARKHFEIIKQAKIAEDSYIKFYAHRDPSVKDKFVPSEPNCIDKILKDTTEHTIEIIGMPAMISEKLTKYFNQVDETMMNIFEQSNADIFTIALNTIANFANRTKADNEEIHMKLHRIHECFGVDYAPFASHKEVSAEQMISAECCQFGIPMKTVPVSGHILTKEESMKNIKECLSSAALAHIPEVTTVILKQNESHDIILELQGQLITKLMRKNCLFYILSDNLQIITGDEHIRVEVSDVEKLLFKTVHHMPTGIELFTRNNASYLISIDRYNSMTALRAISGLPEFKNKFIQVEMPIEELKKQKYTEQWQNGKISNFEYIMILNSIAGRSFNTLANYPICPFVLKPSSESKKEYRDLSKPMADKCKSFSTPDFVAKILSNVEPFKTYSEGNKFASYAELYECATKEGFELPPEFYTCSYASKAFYQEFGCASEEEFVKMMRDALESKEVTEKLPKWIDLVFGVKQPSFDKKMTENAWNNDEDIDPKKRIETDECMETCGIIPMKLFNQAHPEFKFEDNGNKQASSIIESGMKDIDCVNINNTTAACFTKDKKIALLSFNTAANEFGGKKDIPVIHEISCLNILENGTVACGTANGTIVSFDKDQLSEKLEDIVSYDRITCMNNSNTLLVCGTTGGYINIFDSRNFDELASIPLFSGEVKSIACSDAFGIIVAITETRLVVISEYSKTPSFSYEFSEKVAETHVCITNQTGLIIATRGKKLMAFNINGKMIKEGEVEIDVHHVCTVCGLEDTIVIADNKKALAVDPITLSVQAQVVSQTDDEIAAIAPSGKSNSVIEFTKSGQFCFIGF